MGTIRRILGWLREKAIRVLAGRRSVIANVTFEQRRTETLMHYRGGDPISFGNTLIHAQEPTVYPQFSRN